MATIAHLIDKYNKLLSRVSPGDPVTGHLLEEIVDDLTDCVVQGGATELLMIKTKAYRDGYNAAKMDITHRIEALVGGLLDDRSGNGG